MSTTETVTAPVDRLLERFATLKGSAAAADEMYTVLDTMRDRVRKLPLTPGEDPKAARLAGFMAGLDAYELALAQVASGRRGDVLAKVREWLADVVALSDAEYRMTLRPWAARAKAAREDNQDAYKPRARA